MRCIESHAWLADAKIPVKLHAGNRLEACQAEVDADGPFAHGDVGPRHWRSRPDAELGPAIRAPVWHGLGVRNLAGIDASALPAMAFAVRPYAFLKPLGGRVVRGEHVPHLDQGYAFAMGHFGGLVYCEAPLAGALYMESVASVVE